MDMAGSECHYQQQLHRTDDIVGGITKSVNKDMTGFGWLVPRELCVSPLRTSSLIN